MLPDQRLASCNRAKKLQEVQSSSTATDTSIGDEQIAAHRPSVAGCQRRLQGHSHLMVAVDQMATFVAARAGKWRTRSRFSPNRVKIDPSASVPRQVDAEVAGSSPVQHRRSRDEPSDPLGLF